MAKSQFKAGGPTRGRRRVRKIGMGSGKYLLARKEARKGVHVSEADRAAFEAANNSEGFEAANGSPSPPDAAGN